ncbi:MAG: hypothetical protein J6A67_07310 [Clostridia bacterium]|nr:hypothetical protein [Clostridia bacterium]
MVGTVVPILVGLLLIVLGIVNMTGNVSTLHSYHRQRVTEENRKPFGKMVGLGTLIAGLGIVAVGVTIFLAEKLQNEVFVTLGIVLLPTFLIPGIVLMVIAMKKYNGGIF